MQPLPLEDYLDLHAGEPGAILGGGPSLIDDLTEVPRGVVAFGINRHAAMLRPVDYTVVYDQRDDLADLRRPSYAGTVITPYDDNSEVVLPDRMLGDAKRGRMMASTGCAALWLAEYMGCSPIWLCGMECYQGPDIYWHGGEATREQLAILGIKPLEYHVAPWRRTRELLRHPKRVHAVSGPLLDVFPAIQTPVAA